MRSIIPTNLVKILLSVGLLLVVAHVNGQTIVISTPTSSQQRLTSGTLEVTGTGSINTTDINAISVTTGGAVTEINNNGTINTISTLDGGDYRAAIRVDNTGTVGQIINSGQITTTGSPYTVSFLPGQIFTVMPGFGIDIDGTANIGTILNNASGTINGIRLTGNTNIGTITNFGTITDPIGVGGIYNELFFTSTIGTLNNLQGSSGALVYGRGLPRNYNIIINSPTSYGKLNVSDANFNGVVRTTTFGIYLGSTVANGTYVSVLTGVTSSNLTSTTGTFGSATWLLSNVSSNIWDLIISGYVEPVVIPVGPSTVDTQQSLVNTASALQSTYTLQNSVLANSFSYDCNVFGANNVCVSAGGRNTAVSAANGFNNTSALLIAAYRPHPNYRIGAYADQNLSVSNPGGTVNLGNNTPLIGLFGAWSQRLDGTGAEVKVSAAYGQKNTTVNRSVVGSGATASEAGSGSSTLNSQGAQVTAKYGFAVTDKAMISPYVGVRYTQNNMGGYTEGTSSSVTAPLTYSALNTNATTALAGVGASYKVIPTVTTFASAGVETDTNAANGSYSATGVTGLTAVNFNANPVKTRPTATLGAYYDITKNQRLGITGIYRQEAYQAVQTTTVMANYTIGL